MNRAAPNHEGNFIGEIYQQTVEPTGGKDSKYPRVVLWQWTGTIWLETASWRVR